MADWQFSFKPTLLHELLVVTPMHTESPLLKGLPQPAWNDGREGKA